MATDEYGNYDWSSDWGYDWSTDWSSSYDYGSGYNYPYNPMYSDSNYNYNFDWSNPYSSLGDPFSYGGVSSTYNYGNGYTYPASLDQMSYYDYGNGENYPAYSSYDYGGGSMFPSFEAFYGNSQTPFSFSLDNLFGNNSAAKQGQTPSQNQPKPQSSLLQNPILAQALASLGQIGAQYLNKRAQGSPPSPQQPRTPTEMANDPQFKGAMDQIKQQVGSQMAARGIGGTRSLQQIADETYQRMLLPAMQVENARALGMSQLEYQNWLAKTQQISAIYNQIGEAAQNLAEVYIQRPYQEAALAALQQEEERQQISLENLVRMIESQSSRNDRI